MLISSLSLSQALPCVLRSLTWGRSSAYHSLDGSLGLISLCSPNSCETSLQCLLDVLVMITAKIQVFPPPIFGLGTCMCVHLSLCKASQDGSPVQNTHSTLAQRFSITERCQKARATWGDPTARDKRKKQAWPKVKVSNSVLQGERSLIPLSLHPEEALCRKSIQITFSLGFYCIAHHPITTWQITCKAGEKLGLEFRIQPACTLFTSFST